MKCNPEFDYKTYAFSRKVELLPLHLRKDFQELLHEPDQLSRKVFFVLENTLQFQTMSKCHTEAYSYIRYALRIPSTNRLLHPKDVCKFCPAVFIWCRLGLAIRPRKRL
jgi:hypothetical protein